MGKDTSSTPRGGTRMETKLSILTSKAKENPNERFTSLMHLLNEDFLESCFNCLKRGKAAGADGITVAEYGENLTENIKDLVGRLRNWQYRPKPARRVYIPKGGGKMRPLGITSVEDKIVQLALKRILEAIYEADFLAVSFGFFMPGRNKRKLKEWWGILGRRLEGHYRYYGISGNMKEMQSYYSQAISKTFKWVNRRSQKRSYNWLQFCRYLQNNPLPKPRIHHSYPVLW